MHFLVSIFLLISSCQAAPPPRVTRTNISTKLLPSSTSPLAQLLATATASENTDVTPTVFQLAATQRNKRKPNKFRPKGESRFRPKSGRQHQVASSENTDQKNHEGQVTTAQPSLVLQGYFGTPEPKDSPTEDNSGPFIVKPTFPIPFVLSNDISSDQFDQSHLFERLQSITGAQPVGVTRDIAQAIGVPRDITQPVGVTRDITQPIGVPRDITQPVGVTRDITQPIGVTRDIAQHTPYITGHVNHKKHKKTSDPIERKGSSHKKGVPQKSLPEEGEHKSVESRDENARQLSDPFRRQSSRRGSPSRLPQEQNKQKGTYPLPPRYKKLEKAKKRNLDKSFVGTLDRYQYENEDGSITWGYQNEDGGFKEETIGMDCITHGRYGYTDPSGEEREYGYNSGVRCDPHNRKVGVSDTGSDGSRGTNGNGFFEYTQNRFVMPDGRRVTVVVNEHNKARGRRY